MYEKIFKKLNEKAKINGDIPVSCIITKNGKIISKSKKKKYSKNNPLGHAEILAILSASKKLKTSNLIECTMYVTLKPCKMCQEIIKESRIKNVYYIIDNKKYNRSKINFNKIECDENYFKNELKNFFKEKR